MATKLALLTSTQWTTFLGLGTHFDPETPPQVLDSIAAGTGYRMMAYDSDTGDVTAAPSGPVWGQSVGRDGDGNLDSSKTFAYPTLNVGKKTLVLVSASAASTGTGGALTPPAFWTYEGLANDGEATARGKVAVYSFTYAQWVSAGSPADATITSASSCYMAASFVEWTPVTGTVEIVFGTGSDPASITAAAGLGNYLAVVAFTRTRNDSVLATAPTGYANLTGCDTGGTATNEIIFRTLWTATKSITAAATEDPGAAGTGSPSGAARMAISVLLG